MKERERMEGDDPGILSSPGEGQGNEPSGLRGEKSPGPKEDSLRAVAGVLIGIGTGLIIGSRFNADQV